jgi:hypothetical protein
MMVPKSMFLSKFPISKWSFVNLGLFKSLELTKYIIYSHRTKTLMLEKLGGNVPSSRKVHTWCHDDDNVLMSPSCALCSNHPCFVQKNIFSFGVLFSIIPQSYLHTQWRSFFHCSTILRTPCIILPLHLHIPSRSINIIGLFFYRLYMFTSLCFSLLCSFLLVHGDHHPLVEGLSPFKGSSFLSLYFIVATFSSLFVCALWFCLASCKWSSFTISIKG